MDDSGNSVNTSKTEGCVGKSVHSTKGRKILSNWGENNGLAIRIERTVN